jgi:hypothetical protein
MSLLGEILFFPKVLTILIVAVDGLEVILLRAALGKYIFRKVFASYSIRVHPENYNQFKPDKCTALRKKYVLFPQYGK